jgi:LmbE family N-acetylglucosaminyl deacetylase
MEGQIVPDSNLAGRTVLAVFAHPDDESLACGGTLARLSDAGARVVLLCASQGRKGAISDPALVPDGDLGRVRAEELRAAASVLGIADVVILDHPDGDLRWADAPLFDGEITSAIRDYRADAVITFDDDGLYWHLDHVGIHERTWDAVEALGADAPSLYFVTIPKGVIRHVVDAAISMGWTRPASGPWAIVPDAFGLHSKPPTVVIDVSDWVGRKLEAVSCHRTQMGVDNPFTRLDPAAARRWLGTEQFRRLEPQTGCSLLEPFGQPGLVS